MGKMHEFMTLATAVARKAGNLQRTRLWQEHEISFKGAIDLVTEVDRACEELIVSEIARFFPQHDILAEENLYQDRKASHKWIIDPLDGTTNYAHGFPWFCVSIALEIEGRVRLGVIYHPMMDEMFTVIEGEGAYVNGERIQVSKREPLKKAMLATGFPYDIARDNENNFDNFINLHLASRAVRRAGAAALDLAYVAAGRLDGYWECKLKPWDVAAGQLLVKEAGGEVTGYRGEPYSIYSDRIVASNGLVHKEMLQVLAAGGGRC